MKNRTPICSPATGPIPASRAALKKAGSPSDLLLCKKRDHATIMVNFLDTDDTLNEAFREFVMGKGK